MSTTLHLLSLAGEREALFLAAQKAEIEYWLLIGGKGEPETPPSPEEIRAADEAWAKTGEAWYRARVAMDRSEQLPILEASHRDTEECALIELFAATDDFTLTVSDSNIEEIADAWEDSDKKRTFSLGRGKGTVYSWLLAHRGEKITIGS